MKPIFIPFLLSVTLFANNGFISVDELKKNIDNPNYIILDISDLDTYRHGHIKHSVITDV